MSFKAILVHRVNTRTASGTEKPFFEREREREKTRHTPKILDHSYSVSPNSDTCWPKVEWEEGDSVAGGAKKLRQVH